MEQANLFIIRDKNTKEMSDLTGQKLSNWVLMNSLKNISNNLNK